jgi:glycosyltransferase involved in cell wall biosynthesis
MMKFNRKVVVQVVQHLRAGGIECLVLEMLRSSQISKNEDMYIISLEGTMEEALSSWPRLLPYKNKLYFVNKKYGVSIDCLLKIRKILKLLHADVVHSHHIGPLLYAGIVARFSNISSRIHTEHDAWHMQNNKRRWLERLLLKFVKPILVADANGVKKQLDIYQQGYPSHVIHNGVDCTLFHKGNQAYARTRLELPKKGIRIVGCSGRLTAVKGHKYLIEALKFLPDDCMLLLAGEGEYRSELEALIKLNRLDDRVVLLGNIDDMVYFYQSLDVFCMSSLNEGLPLSPLEAQACGVPVVLTDVGGCREACCPESGILVPAQDSAALAWAIRKVLINIVLNKIRSPRQFVIEERDFSKMLNEYRILYQTQS